ncbi:outer membrane lipoprotein carrier protein LolA [Maricaulis sp.]|uniref:LolA family protein n=1 Tax=Maricaulis sp. TaxID=1486257 RepID=UPI001B2073DC|nr:outer membrane lipoprotein carrier protein LolA [Maricaulis sp.]MBO6795786.1 outer membrane lipoprotein carrier protein LolA [Maricaulis sp.]
MITMLLSSLFLQAADPAQTTPEQSTAEPASAETTAADTFDADAAMAGINGYLNSVDTMRARFTQVSPHGALISGLLSMDRPGRLRFEYDDPSPITVIADGTTVAIEDAALETVDRAPIRSTPLYWLLADEIDLAADAEIIDVVRELGFIYVTLRDPNDEMQGTVQFVFEEPTYILREWFVTDALGQMTRVIIQDQEVDVELSPRLFVIPEPDDGRDSRRGRR